MNRKGQTRGSVPTPNYKLLIPKRLERIAE